MADWQLGDRRKRGSSADSWLLLLAIIVAGTAYYRFVAPSTAGAWEGAATQIKKKYDRLLLYYPAWDRQVLHELPEMPVVMLDTRQHLDLAGLKEVLFASEGADPEAVVNNLFTVTEWRDFAGKAVAVMRVADRGLVVDFPRLALAVDDPPGIAQCEVQGESAKCNQPNVVIERRPAPAHASSRCLWVKTNADRPAYVRWKDQTGFPMKRAKLFVWRTADPEEGKDAMMALFSHGQRVGDVTQEEGTQTLQFPTASDEIEVVLDAPHGACFDLELMP